MTDDKSVADALDHVLMVLDLVAAMALDLFASTVGNTRLVARQRQ